MSNVQKCIDLYLTDEQVSDAQFRTVIVDARARDLIDGGKRTPGWLDAPLTDDEISAIGNAVDKVADTLEEQGRALVLLNRIDDVRRDQIGALDADVRKLTGFCDSLAGQVRVLRERLDNLEGK